MRIIYKWSALPLRNSFGSPGLMDLVCFPFHSINVKLTIKIGNTYWHCVEWGQSHALSITDNGDVSDFL